MAKIQLKSDNINPFGGLFSILDIFNRSGLQSVVDRHLGRCGMARAAFTHGHQFIAAQATLDDAAAWNTLEKVTV